MDKASRTTNFTVNRLACFWMAAAALIAGLAAVCIIPTQESAYAEKNAATAAMITNPHEVPPVEVSGVGAWKAFEDANRSLGCTFEYPENWAVGTEQGRKQPYAQAIILGPRNASNTFSAGLTIRRMPVKFSGGLYADLQDLVDARQKQLGSHPQYRKLESGQRLIVGLPAQWVVAEYQIPLPSHGVQASPIAIRTKSVAFSSGSGLYELSFSAEASQYTAYGSVFEHLLDTFKLSQAPPAQPS